MADNIDELIIASWMRRARRQANPTGWLTGINTAAVDAMAEGDAFVLIVSMEGSSSTSERKYDSAMIARVSEICLQRFEAESAAGGADKIPAPGSVRYGSFS